MTIYSKMLNEQEITDSLPNESKRILIVACGSCMNESLAFENELPISIYTEEGENVSIASVYTAQKLAAKLENLGYETKIIVDGICIIRDNNKTLLLESIKSFKPDTILSISCKAGLFGIKKLTDIKAIIVTKHVGYLSIVYKENGYMRYIKHADVSLINKRNGSEDSANI